MSLILLEAYRNGFKTLLHTRCKIFYKLTVIDKMSFSGRITIMRCLAYWLAYSGMTPIFVSFSLIKNQHFWYHGRNLLVSSYSHLFWQYICKQLKNITKKKPWKLIIKKQLEDNNKCPLSTGSTEDMLNHVAYKLFYKEGCYEISITGTEVC